MSTGVQDGSLLPALRLFQLTSSQCPIGAFAYSQGLEAAIEQSWVSDEGSLVEWLCGVGEHTLAALDLPVLARAHEAWSRADEASALALAEELLARREARELAEQERQLGRALAAVLANLGVPRASALLEPGPPSYVVGYALGAAHFQIDSESAALGYAFAWVEQQIHAAARLVPLGHSSAQRALSQVLSKIPGWLIAAGSRPAGDLGSLTPGLAMAAAWHEVQYTRLFRS